MRTALVACSLALVCGVGAGCGSKKSKASPEVVGLAAVPASAQVVITADVARVVGSPLVARAIDQLLLKDGELATRWNRLRESCKLDPNQLRHIVLAIGPKTGNDPGTGPVLMVATGKLVEADLASCVRAMVGQGGGTLTAKEVSGRTLYQAKEGNRTMFFAFGRPDTVVLGSNEAYVTEALGTGKKVLDDPDLAGWIRLVDQKVPVWAVGRVDERVRGGLVRVTSGHLKEGPKAMIVGADPTDGVKLSVSAVMASTADAKALESFAKTQLGLMAMAAQFKSLGKIVDKIAISSENEVARFAANLGVEEVNLLISALDGGGITAQDSPPPTDPGPHEAKPANAGDRGPAQGP